MINRVSFINMDHIKSLYLLDDVCDAPDNANWDPEVSEGENPLVIYEALDGYSYLDYSKGSPIKQKPIELPDIPNFLDQKWKI